MTETITNSIVSCVISTRTCKSQFVKPQIIFAGMNIKFIRANDYDLETNN